MNRLLIYLWITNQHLVKNCDIYRYRSIDLKMKILPGDVQRHDQHPGERGEEEELKQDGDGCAAQRCPLQGQVHN